MGEFLLENKKYIITDKINEYVNLFLLICLICKIKITIYFILFMIKNILPNIF